MQFPFSTVGGEIESVLTRALTPNESVTASTPPKPSTLDWSPNFDMKAVETEVVVYMDLPGIDEDQLNIEILPREILIEGERPFDHDDEDAEDFVSIGRPYGYFSVRVDLPTAVDPNAATAKYRRGVLRVRMPVADSPFRGRRLHP